MTRIEMISNIPDLPVRLLWESYDIRKKLACIFDVMGIISDYSPSHR